MKKIYFSLIIVLFLLSGCRKVDYIYYPSGQVKTIIKKDRNNIKHGNEKSFYENGKLQSITEYSHGIMEYQSIYFENEQLMWKAPYKEGKMNGEFIEYFTNGKIKLKGNVNNDIFTQYIKYDSIGKVISEYIRLDKNQIPDFKNSYIQIKEDKIYTEKYIDVKLNIPSIPSSQLIPNIVNGTIQLKDRLNGIWEAKALPNHDSVYIGLKIFIDDSTEYLVGYNEYKIFKSIE